MDAPNKLGVLLEVLAFLTVATLISSATVWWGGVKIEPIVEDPTLNAHAKVVLGY